MPKTPTGAKRPADTISNAVHVMRVLTGEIEEKGRDPGTEANRRGGLKGGAARAAKLTPAKRKEIAQKAAAKRWKKP